MKLISIGLRGAIGIHMGIGVEEIQLNLEELKGMVALDGDNGKGKTTLLDNLHPYRVLPSRPKKALQHHFYLRDSFRDLELEHDGHRYRFLIKIDPEANKQEGFIYVDGSKESIVTGKVREYDEQVSRLFGSLDLFTSSVFCAQKTDDSKMTVGQMKDQWAEFLKLHELQAHSETAKQSAKIIGGHVQNLSRDIEQREGVVESLKYKPDVLKQATGKADENAIQYEAWTDHVAVLEKELQAAMESEAEDAATRQKIEHIGTRISEIESDIREAQSTFDSVIGNKEGEIAKISGRMNELKITIDMADEIEKASAKVGVIDEKLDDLREQQRHQDKMLAGAQAELSTLESEHKDNDIENSKAISVLDRKRDRIKTHISKLGNRVAELKRALSRLEDDAILQGLHGEMHNLNRRTELLDMRPDECNLDGCDFIKDALAAQDERKVVESKIKSRQAFVDQGILENKAEIDELDANSEGALDYARSISAKAAELYRDRETQKQSEAKAIKAIHQKVNGYRISAESLQTEIANMKAMREKYADLSKNLPMVAAAKAEYGTLFDQLASLKREIRTKTDERAQYASTKRATIVRLEHDRDQLAKSIKGGKAANVRDRIRVAKEYISELTDGQKAVEREIATLEKDIDRLNESLAELETLKSKKSALEQEASEWMYLSNAFGKNGLQALEIDNVAPAISAIANDLLASTYGPTMQVMIDTLNDSNRETLDTWVLRSDGSKSLLDDFSGGEKVWILKALRLARTIIGKERSGADIRTAFSDEEDGALRHGETSENFIRMFRAFIDRAGIDTCFYISHKPECIGMADHVINFANGGVTAN